MALNATLKICDTTNTSNQTLLGLWNIKLFWDWFLHSYLRAQAICTKILGPEILVKYAKIQRKNREYIKTIFIIPNK